MKYSVLCAMTLMLGACTGHAIASRGTSTAVPSPVAQSSCQRLRNRVINFTDSTQWNVYWLQLNGQLDAHQNVVPGSDLDLCRALGD